MHSKSLTVKNSPGHVFSRKFLSSFLSAVLLVSMLLPVSPAPVLAADPPTLKFPDPDVTITATGENGTLAAPPTALPVFEWYPVAGATTYAIQFCRDINCANTLTPVLTPLTKYTPPSISFFNDGEWWWRVQVATPAPAGSYSAPRRFVKQWASEGNKPTLNSPLNGATLEFFDNPVFSWDPVIGAAYYQFQYSTDPSFPVGSITTKDTISTSYQPTDPFSNGIYYWRVVPYDPGNPAHKGTASDYRSFTMGYNQVPVLLEPLSGSKPTFTPVLRWTAVRGAQDYHLQVSTDPSFATSFKFNANVDNTTFTFTAALENDKNYYWRVRSYNGKSYSKWSNEDTAPWYFTKSWYIKPELLTPTSGYQHVRFPFFSWAPVPGAAKYKIQMSLSSGFSPLEFEELTDNNTFYTPKLYKGDAGLRYWKVTPYDGNNNPGTPESGSFYSAYTKNSPVLAAPLYYYTPSELTNPHEDRSVAYPLFTWLRVFDVETGDIFPSKYHIAVGTDTNPDGTVGAIVWETDTENLSASPNMGEFPSFTPGTIYYWQVTPLDADGAPIGEVSQIWKTRFDPAKAPPATTGGVPQLLRPFYTATYDPNIHPGVDSDEFVEVTPALEWYPMAGATRYMVEISRSADMSNPVSTGNVTYPAYVPRLAFGQRSLNKLGFGSYYWHVKALVGSTWTSWSDTWRFQIAAQSAWQSSRMPGSSIGFEVARDPEAGEVAVDYDLTGVYANEDADNWYFGFNYSGTGAGKYVMYLDQDNRNGSGATFDKFSYPITSNLAHRPEYAIYFTKAVNTGFTSQTVVIYHWLGTAWDSGATLYSQGGSLVQDGSFVEIKVPFALIGMNEFKGTYSLAMASVNTTANTIMDTAPKNTITSGAATLDNITTVSEHLSLSAPANDLAGDPTVYPSAPPFFWNAPTGAPWSGYWGEVHRDVAFTSKSGEIDITSTGAYYVDSDYGWLFDFNGDNTYYWRIRPRYRVGPNLLNGAWSQPWRFERKGLIPLNLQVTSTDAIPTFRWDRVDGAKTYLLTYSTDPTFPLNNATTNVTTTENVYTPNTFLTNATYYWKVKVNRENTGVSNDWAYPAQRSFTVALPIPTGLSADGKGDGLTTSANVDRAPTLCWDVLNVMNGQNAVMYAAKYHLQISKDPNFTPNWEDITTQSNCYTPAKGYDEGRYYWKVSMIDGTGGTGHNSADSVRATFVKQYPIVKPKFPVNGSASAVTPVFSWTAADGVTPYVFGAASYKINVSKYSNIPTGEVDSVTTNSTTFTPTKAYPVGQPLYWQVAMIDKDGKVGPFTNALIILDDKPYHVYLPMTAKK